MISIGIIPARGGSKSIPLKNIRLFNGKPLIEYTIESALNSGVLDKIVVSTDHDGIAEVCEKYKGVDIILRPKKLSTDEALTESALLSVCDELEENNNFIPDIVLTLEPTSPMRTAQTIKNSIEILEVFHCPHVPEDKCYCRKPQPGMINKAVKKFNLDIKNSIVVGDKKTDISAGISAGILQNYLIHDSNKNKDKDSNLYIYNSLYQLVCKSNVIKL